MQSTGDAKSNSFTTTSTQVFQPVPEVVPTSKKPILQNQPQSFTAKTQPPLQSSVLLPSSSLQHGHTCSPSVITGARCLSDHYVPTGITTAYSCTKNEAKASSDMNVCKPMAAPKPILRKKPAESCIMSTNTTTVTYQTKPAVCVHDRHKATVEGTHLIQASVNTLTYTAAASEAQVYFRPGMNAVKHSAVVSVNASSGLNEQQTVPANCCNNDSPRGTKRPSQEQNATNQQCPKLNTGYQMQINTMHLSCNSSENVVAVQPKNIASKKLQNVLSSCSTDEHYSIQDGKQKQIKITPSGNLHDTVGSYLSALEVYKAAVPSKPSNELRSAAECTGLERKSGLGLKTPATCGLIKHSVQKTSEKEIQEINSMPLTAVKPQEVTSVSNAQPRKTSTGSHVQTQTIPFLVEFNTLASVKQVHGPDPSFLQSTTTNDILGVQAHLVDANKQTLSPCSETDSNLSNCMPPVRESNIVGAEILNSKSSTDQPVSSKLGFVSNVGYENNPKCTEYEMMPSASLHSCNDWSSENELAQRQELMVECLEEVRIQIPLQLEKLSEQTRRVQKLSKQLESEEKHLEALQLSNTALHARYIELSEKYQSILKTRVALLSERQKRRTVDM